MEENKTHSEDKVEDKNSQNDWMHKFQEMINSCQVELKKTTQIGMKMLSASQSNAQLHECYESLGVLIREAIKKGEVNWSDQRVDELMGKIDKLEVEMEEFEKEVHEIKRSQNVE